MKTPIVKIKAEAGYWWAVEGLALCYGKALADMPDVAQRLYDKDGGHSKFLESIQIWMLVTLPRHIWQQFDTYRIGVTKQSESTMHTILKAPLTQDNFDAPILASYLNHLNGLIARREFAQLKNALPEGFLQTRMVCTNYKALRHIMRQRYNHKMPHWRQFCLEVIKQLQYKEFFGDILQLLGVIE
jgi:hypothetical protein